MRFQAISWAGGKQRVYTENELYKIINLVVASSAISPIIFLLKHINYNLLLYMSTNFNIGGYFRIYSR